MSEDGLKLSKVAIDIADLIGTGQMESDQLAVIEAACRTQRMILGPAKRNRGGEELGRKRKRLRKPTAEDISNQLAAFAGTTTAPRTTPQPPPQGSASKEDNERAFYRAFDPEDEQFYRNDYQWKGKWYSKNKIVANISGKKFVMPKAAQTMSGSLFKVEKVNRVNAKCRLLDDTGSPTDTVYNVPFSLILQSYLEGGFQ